MSTHFHAEGLSDLGCHRTTNEDRFYINNDLGLFIVADGIGGIPGGEVAAGIIIDHLPELLKQSLPEQFKLSDINVQTLIQEKILAINDFVCREGIAQNLKDMGSTLVCAFIQNNHAFILNVGDSRAYLHNASGLKQISKDHTAVQELVDQDKVAPQDSSDHPGNFELTESIGVPGTININSVLIDLKKSDQILLCSDGLSDMLSDAQIEQILNEQNPKPCVQLIEMAKEEGGDDNITVILIKSA